MSGLKPITVNTAPEAEPNICAEDDAAIYQSIFGEDGVSSIGQACKATVLSNNKVRIADGVICVGGHFARIPYGDYIDCEIENGQSGKNRNDIIVARFETTGTGGIDTYTCEVKKGTAGTVAADPEITQDDLYKAGKVRELPLYRVKIEGLSITAVEQLFELRKTNEDLEKELAELNSKSIKNFISPDVDTEKLGCVEFFNGLKIVFGSVKCNYANPNVLAGSASFPVAFSQAPYVTTGVGNIGNTYDELGRNAKVNISTTAIGIAVHDVYSKLNSSSHYYVNFIAIGI